MYCISEYNNLTKEFKKREIFENSDFLNKRIRDSEEFLNTPFPGWWKFEVPFTETRPPFVGCKVSKKVLAHTTNGSQYYTVCVKTGEKGNGWKRFNCSKYIECVRQGKHFLQEDGSVEFFDESLKGDNPERYYPENIYFKPTYGSSFPGEGPYSGFMVHKWYVPSRGRWVVQINDPSNILRNISGTVKANETMLFARYIMEITLGRVLDPNFEHVDHINGDKTDDRPENLQILSPEENRYKMMLLGESSLDAFCKLVFFEYYNKMTNAFVHSPIPIHSPSFVFIRMLMMYPSLFQHEFYLGLNGVKNVINGMSYIPDRSSPNLCEPYSISKRPDIFKTIKSSCGRFEYIEDTCKVGVTPWGNAFQNRSNTGDVTESNNVLTENISGMKL